MHFISEPPGLSLGPRRGWAEEELLDKGRALRKTWRILGFHRRAKRFRNDIW